MNLYIGLMSGTSMDGIDAALVDVANHTLIAGVTRPYSDDLRRHLSVVLAGERLLPSELSQLNTRIGREFAAAVHQVFDHVQGAITVADVAAIGSHGQTICHDAFAEIPYTMQLGCPHTIAELTGLTVVADFRMRDLVLGGQGAPYAPLYHQVLFGQRGDQIAIVNIGGIANITSFTAASQVSGYDTGPGNCLMDAWAQRHLSQPYDADGIWAATGKVIPNLLSALLADPYFILPPPKSIGKEYFSLEWLKQYIPTCSAEYSAENVQATLLQLTATSIANAVNQLTTSPRYVGICGGGAHNHMLLNAIQAQLLHCKVTNTQTLNVDPDYLEAMMFAWLAHQTLTQTSLDLRSITGSKKPAILGAIYLNQGCPSPSFRA